jgi:hypothetical protein
MEEALFWLIVGIIPATLFWSLVKEIDKKKRR